MKWSWIAALAIVLGTAASIAQEQQQVPTGQPAATNNPEREISTQDLNNAIKVQVNLVLVRVVVRDAAGKTVPDLKQEDFRIWDNGRQQKVSTFSVETAEAREQSVLPPVESGVSAAEPSRDANAKPGAEALNAPAIPQRFVVLLFDDLHMKLAEQLAVHAATEKLFASLRSTDRVAIYSTQGNVQQDFTSDVVTLRKTLANIVPHSARDEGHYECPNISYYQARLIVYQRDDDAMQAASVDALINNCPVNVQATAERILREGDAETRESYQDLDNVVSKLSDMPGQRLLVYVSPGFLVGQAVFPNSSDWIERAVRSGVVVNTIDSRGLYTVAGLPDIAAPPQAGPFKHLDQNGGLAGDPEFDYQGMEGTFREQAQFESGQELAGMAADTGGTYFHNRNDLDIGMSRALAAPSTSYMLGFRPQDVTADGKVHQLKVEVANGKKYQIQARKGYFASKRLADPEEDAKQQVNERLFSQDEIVSIPVQLKTQFFKTNDTSAQLTVLTHLDGTAIHFRKVGGRSCDEVVLATGVFDLNGQFVGGEMKEVALKLTDSTLQKINQRGITIKAMFTLKPGTYMLRSVVRESQGQQLTAKNLMAIIPEK